MNNRLRKIYIALSAASISILFFCNAVFAAEGRVSVMELHDKSGRMISGLELRLYQLAERNISGELEVRPEFSDILDNRQITELEHLSADGMRGLSIRLRDAERAAGINPFSTAYSDARGTADFETALPEGLYLLDYEEREHIAANPSVLAIPTITVDSNGIPTASYSIRLSAKLEDDTPEQTKPTVPDTPDEPDEPTPGEPERPTSPEPEEPERPIDPVPDIPDTPGDVLGAVRKPIEQAAERVLGALRSVSTGDESLFAVFTVIAVFSGGGFILWLLAYMRRKSEKENDNGQREKGEKTE